MRFIKGRMAKIFGLILLIQAVSISTCLFSQTYIRADIQRVLVDPATNNVHVYYAGTNHPEISHYKISQWKVTGNNPFSTGVPIEASSTPHTGLINYHWSGYIEEVMRMSVGFTVGAYNSSEEPLPPPPKIADSTIYLSVQYDSCIATAHLQWNDYNAWRGNIEGYDINNMDNAGNSTLLASVSGNTLDTVISGLIANNNYRFYITAWKDRAYPDSFVTSNGVLLSTRHAYYPLYIHSDFGTVDGSNNPYLNFSIDPLSELNKYLLYRSESPSGFYSIIDSLISGENLIEYTDEQVNASEHAYYYRLAAVNYCEEIITSSENTAGTILLTGDVNGTAVNLEWSPYYQWLSGVDHYSVQRNTGDNDFTTLYEGNLLSFTDNSMSNLSGQNHSNEVCYRIIASEMAGGQYSGQATSTSNIVCIRLPLNIRFEFDAFVPGSANFSSFGPSMDFIPDYFEFKIFNRSGNKVFESRDPYSPRWDGRYLKGDFVPEGIYRYQLEFKDENGNKTSLTGKVSVVRE